MLLVVGRHWSPTWTATSMYPTADNWWWDSVEKQNSRYSETTLYNNHKSELHMSCMHCITFTSDTFLSVLSLTGSPGTSSRG